MNPWHVFIALASGLALLWIALVASLYIVARRHAERTSLSEAVRLVPDVIRLLGRLAADPTLPRGVRVRIGAVLVYLFLPIDLAFDFIPIIGYADDAIIILVVLRSVARRAGVAAIDQHWPGTDEGFRAIKQFAGLPS